MFRVPRDLPIFGALLLGGWILANGFAAMLTEQRFGRPSSTAALGYVFIPLVAGGAAAVGFVAGYVVRRLWNRLRPPAAQTRRSWAMAITLMVAIGIAAGLGINESLQVERDANPQVRKDLGIFVRDVRPDSGNSVRKTTRLYDSDVQGVTIKWANRDSTVVFNDRDVVLQDKPNPSTVAGLRYAGLDYVNRVDAVEIASKDGRGYLGIVIAGRATGRRAVIAVVDDSYRVVFEELVQRFWDLRDNPIEARVDSSGRQYFVVGPCCMSSIVLTLK